MAEPHVLLLVVLHVVQVSLVRMKLLVVRWVFLHLYKQPKHYHEQEMRPSFNCKESYLQTKPSTALKSSPEALMFPQADLVEGASAYLGGRGSVGLNL